jgi:hypothetical protein
MSELPTYKVTPEIMAAASTIERRGLDADTVALAASDSEIDSGETEPTDRETSENSDKGQQKQGVLWRDDPSLPLPNPKHERFLQAIAQGASKTIAYLEHVSPMATHKTATEQVSRLLKRVEFQERLRLLIRVRSVKEMGKGPEASAGGREAGKGEMSRDELIGELEGVVRNRQENTSDRLSAADKLAKLKGFVKDGNARKDVPDPAFMAAFLRRAAALNKDVVEVCREAENTLPVGG